MAEKENLTPGRADGITRQKTATEQQGSTDFVIGAPSFSPGYYPHWGILRVPKYNEAFLLTDRSFTGKPFANGGINKFFGSLPSRIIRKLERVNPQVNVVDIGGGRNSSSAKEIVEIHPKAVVTNVDPVIEKESCTGHLVEKPGSILDLPVPSGSADLVYSHQVLPFLDQTQQRPYRALSEVVRILSPGGIALIDDGHFSSPDKETNIALLAATVGADIQVRDKSYGDRFLILFKPPANLELVD